MAAALSFAAYFVYAYIVAPIALRGAQHVLFAPNGGIWYQVCPLLQCAPALIECFQEQACKGWLDDVQECTYDQSEARTIAATTFAHVQYPHDPAFCRYLSFDRLETETALSFLECVGASGCLEPSPYTDECVARFGAKADLPMPPEDVLAGRWNKLFTTGWDMWPCQWTDFHAPKSDTIQPEQWMTAWPQTDDVWRMDLYWRNSLDGKVTFHMCNEMYLGETWDFQHESKNESLPVTPPSTLKTRAVMWGTEAHENWYLLDYNPEWQTMMLYFCAYTADVVRFDSMTMVLQKEGAEPLSNDQSEMMEELARQLLGEKHGKLQRIPQCAG
jgi:hypothetical protein